MVAFIRRAVCPIRSGDARLIPGSVHTGVVNVADELLEPAFKAARRALSELDEEEVPARLKRVAASSARRLPVPLRRSLRAELEASSWLRERALEHLDDGDGPAQRASRMFLERPPGWEETLEEVATTEEQERDRREGRQWRQKAEQLEAEVREVRATLRRLERELAARTEQAVEAAVHDMSERLARAGDRVRHLTGEGERLRRELAAATEETRRLGAELAETQRRLAAARERLWRQRREGAATEQAGYGWSRDNPIELARHLDQLVASLQAGEAAGGGAEPPSTSAVLPAGVRPDTPEAIEWVRGLTGPSLLLVDGYNVAFDLGGDDPDESVRRRLEAALRRLWRAADGPLRIVVFYDSATASDSIPTPGVTIRYVRSADDALVEAAREADVQAIVVSSDREVRERAEAVGASTLWGTALARWV